VTLDAGSEIERPPAGDTEPTLWRWLVRQGSLTERCWNFLWISFH